MATAVATAAGQVLFGALLHQTVQKLDTVIDNAGLQANLQLVTAGKQVSLALDQFRNVYSNLLQQTASTVNQVVLQQLQVFDTSVNSLMSQTGTQIQNLSAVVQQVQMVVNSLSFAHLPQVSSRAYSYLPNGQVEIEFNGSFPTAGQSGMVPMLDIGNIRVQTQPSNSNFCIKFIVSQNILFPQHPMMQHVTLIVPTPATGSALNPLNWVGLNPQYQFRGYLQSPSSQAGQVTVNWTNQTSQPVTKTIQGREYIQSSAKHWGHIGHEPITTGHTIHHRDILRQTRTRPYSENATPGWSITSGNVHVFKQRNHYVTITAPIIAPNSVSISIKTEKRHHHHSSGVWFRIDRTEQQEQSVSTPGQALHALPWGGSVFQPCPVGWTVVITPQGGGPVQTYSSPVQNNQITIGYTGTGVQINAPSLQSVSF